MNNGDQDNEKKLDSTDEEKVPGKIESAPKPELIIDIMLPEATPPTNGKDKPDKD